ncbi:MAG: serine/threonine protein kinase [Gemmataceae bacterium]|nr:serine/threonine protein kinase [Gemmataceae bacterium]
MADPFPTGAHDAPADAPADAPPTGGYARPTPNGVAHAPTPPADDLPRAFGRYELRNLLGRGGMGAVYLAHDPGLDRLVALKIPRPVEHGPAVWRDRFLAEARAAATLHHPNICPVYEFGEADGRPYLTMAYIPGETLADRLGRAGPLPVPEAVALVRTAARAMAEAHDRGIVHRDLKPANVMIDRRGQPVVMDFGLALRTAASDDLRLTLSGVAMGTPAYMPPEQAGGEHEAIGPPADVYALGVILYELLTGRVPFRERSFGKLLAQIVRDPPAPPSGFNPAVDPALDALILTALEKEPGRRFATAGALADALDATTRGEYRSSWPPAARRPTRAAGRPRPTSRDAHRPSGAGGGGSRSRPGCWVWASWPCSPGSSTSRPTTASWWSS